MRKKTVSLLLCGIMMMSALAACGNSGSKKTADTGDEKKSVTETSSNGGVVVKAVENKGQFKGQELSILVSAGWMDNRYDATIERFENTYGVTVDLQTIPADQYSDILQSDLANGTCPDIFWIQSNPSGAIESNIGNPAEYCIDFTGADWQDVIPKSRQASCMSDGKLYGQQIWHNSPEYVLVYNKTMFDELGIKQVPTSYDELKKDLKIIKDSGVSIPWFMPGADGWQHPLAFFQIGGVYTESNPNLYDELNHNKSKFADNKKMQEVLQQFKELSDQGYFGEDWIGTDSTNLSNEFGDRKTAMAMSNAGFIRQIKEETGTKDEFGMFCIPLGDNTWYPTNPAGPTMFGNKKTSHEELVKAFFQFICTPESLQEILDKSPQFTNLDVNVDINQHWLPEETAFLKTVSPDKKSVPVLQTGTKYTNDCWMKFGADMIAYCQNSIKVEDVLKNMDKNRAEAAKTAKDPDWQ